ncbi:MAG: hypothetical protein M3024_02015 [Candidatus Dormibacteraeota bacterium]|nr:hypothetical protein [Candidatus Dormibacteraeota bacterium]
MNARPSLVVGVFEDEVRAEQAARSLEVWRKANRKVRIGPIAVVARRLSGTTTWRARGVIRPGRGALIGLVVGFVLLALPAAGAAALAGWVLGRIVFGLAGLIGVVSSSQATLMVVVAALGGAALAALFVGLVGAAIGCLVGLIVGLIDAQVRGLTSTEVTKTIAGLDPGAWATVARAPAAAVPLIRDELARMGGAVEAVPEPPAQSVGAAPTAGLPGQALPEPVLPEPLPPEPLPPEPLLPAADREPEPTELAAATESMTPRPRER